ncbi:uncharacterized protein LOC129234379 [Uloborus diversus]|uniref:uncharacterized protein LOC129234379 n=1 Tax=Uloborus diversus TaxID=327109 RepID=UPI0024098079|nr:uncharacterized protein LOC129234379 [Uloborus diversus]
MGVTSGSYGHLLLPILLKLLPENLILDFHRKRDSDKDTEVTEVITFIKDELRCREATSIINNSSNENSQNKHTNFSQSKRMPSAAALNTTVKQLCIFCKASEHTGINCTKFSDEQKRYKLKKEGRCYKCFLKPHLSSNCKSKLIPCSKCESRDHNYLFCFKEIKDQNLEKDKIGAIVSMMSEQRVKQNKSTLLQTLCVSVSTGNRCILARVLCDSGSEKCFVKSSLVKELKLKSIRKENLLIYPFGQRQPYKSCYDVVVLELNSILQPCNSIKIEALVVPEITGAKVKHVAFEIIETMRKSGYTPSDVGLESEINVLLGSNFLWKIQKGIVENFTKELYVVETIFGHTVQGRTDSNKRDVNCLRVSVGNINTQLKSFWDLESLGIIEKNEGNTANLDAVKEFQANSKFVNGRYEARLLWKDSRELLGNNLEVAKVRFSNLENKLLKNNSLFEDYNSILRDQFDQGIIQLCPEEFVNNDCYYMPHRPVIREDKTTTKTRIVFDASSKQAGYLSLNECLSPGSNLNPNVLDIILKFREHKVAFSADIEKAFLQISIAEEDRNYLRFLYYNNFDIHENIVPYNMARCYFEIHTDFLTYPQCFGLTVLIPWLPRTPDIIPVDFLIWGFLKQEDYKTEVASLQDLSNRLDGTIKEENLGSSTKFIMQFMTQEIDMARTYIDPMRPNLSQIMKWYWYFKWAVCHNVTWDMFTLEDR